MSTKKIYSVWFSAIWTYGFEVEAADPSAAYAEAARRYYEMSQHDRALESDSFELEYIDAEEVER